MREAGVVCHPFTMRQRNGMVVRPDHIFMPALVVGHSALVAHTPWYSECSSQVDAMVVIVRQTCVPHARVELATFRLRVMVAG